MKKTVKFLGLVLIALLILPTSLLAAAVDEAVIGYKLVARNTNDGYITAEIYVQNGIAYAGQVGIDFDSAKVELVNYDKTAIETKVLTNVVKSTVGTMQKVDPDNAEAIESDSSVIIIGETNSDDKLIGSNKLYFAWFANYTAVVDASSSNVKIAEIRFKVKEGASALDKAINLKTSAPESSEGIVGWKSGMFISRALNGKAVSYYADKNPTLSYNVSYTLSSEFVINNDKVLTGYNGAGGEVKIPSGVTKINADVFAESTTSVLLPTAVTQVEDGAFKSGIKIYVSPTVSAELIAQFKNQQYSVILYGDVDGDGDVDKDDLKLYIKSNAGNAQAKEDVTNDTNVLDTKYDNKLTLSDLSALIKYLTKKIDIGYQG